MVASRNKNAAVQDFYMGLDFTNATTRARLKEGSYIAVQVPERPNAFDWDEWVYSPKRRQIVAARDDSPIPYNYIIFSVSRYIS